MLLIDGGAGHADTPYAQHVCQKLVRQVEGLGPSPILGHQQPSGEPLTDDVGMGASGRRRKLCHLHVEVVVENSVERLADGEFATEQRRFYAQGGA